MAIPSQYLALFKEWYAEDGLRDQINNERLLYDLAKKNPRKMGGKYLVEPVIVGRNTSPTNPAFGGVLPAAANRRYVDLLIDVVPNAAGVTLQDDAIKRAQDGDKGAFVSLTKAEVDGAVEDIKNFSDTQLWTGGSVKGLLNEHKASGATAGAFVGGGAGNGNTTTWEYSGTIAPFSGVVAANTNTWVRVDLIRLDNQKDNGLGFPGSPNGYTVSSVANGMVTLGAGTTKFGIFVSDVSSYNTTGQISLTIVSDGAGTSFTTAVVQTGRAIALACSATQLQDAVPANFGTIVDVSRQPQGILSNLFTSTIYGVSRTSSSPVVSTDNTRMQSTALTNNTALTHSRTALDKVRIQDLMNEEFNLSGSQGKVFIVEAAQRSKYYALLTATTNFATNFGGFGGKADVGVKDDSVGKLRMKLGDDGYSFAGKPVLCSQHCPTGIWFHLDPDTWHVREVGEAGWFDFTMDSGQMFTSVIDPATGRPTLNYAAYWVEYYNLYCTGWNKNAVLCGMTL